MPWLETRRIPIFFIAATLLPIVALCWLAVRTLQQDRGFERDRRRQQLEVAAKRVALDIEQDLQRVEAELSEGKGLRLLATGLSSTGDIPILFQPEVVSDSTPLPPELLTAAQLENQNPTSAIAAYRALAASPSPSTRAEALLALGGVLRVQRRFDEALLAYDELERLGAQPVAGGQPAALVARQGRGRTFQESGEKERLRDEAVALARALDKGWAIDFNTFDIYREMVESWGGPAPDHITVERVAGAGTLWRSWRRGELPARGRRVIDESPHPLLATWVAGPDGPVGALFTASQMQERWKSIGAGQQLAVAISHPDGRAIFGSATPAAVTVLPADTRLPFLVAVGSTNTEAGTTNLRTGVVIGGVTLACLLMIALSWGLYRITMRELLLARQQSDFVAAVSHEFRTPLTSMQHLLDLLITRGVRDEDRKSQYYGLLAGETDRLQRMVETLLSFGRVDAGAHVWKLEPLDVAGLVADVCTEFHNELGAGPLLTNVDEQLPPILGDREALTRALWNLLENAAKYSPGGSPIRVFAQRGGTTVVIGVEDRGIGIPVTEQQRVFQKFVRGDEAKRAGIRGVGVGLALVKRIAEAHGGSVHLASEVGSGSTFTVVLPVANSQLPISNSPTMAAG